MWALSASWFTWWEVARRQLLLLLLLLRGFARGYGRAAAAPRAALLML